MTTLNPWVSRMTTFYIGVTTSHGCHLNSYLYPHPHPRGRLHWGRRQRNEATQSGTVAVKVMSSQTSPPMIISVHINASLYATPFLLTNGTRCKSVLELSRIISIVSRPGHIMKSSRQEHLLSTGRKSMVVCLVSSSLVAALTVPRRPNDSTWMSE